MKKFLFEKGIAAISLVLSLLLSALLYGYRGDRTELKQSISVESQQRRSADSLLNLSIKMQIQNHEAVDDQRNIRFESDIQEIKEANIRMEDKLDKVIFSLK